MQPAATAGNKYQPIPNEYGVTLLKKDESIIPQKNL
jgi:hypothetical protein